MCKHIAREAAEEIVKENPNKPFKRLFESVGVINGTQRHKDAKDNS